jgi:hypothetical protein
MKTIILLLFYVGFAQEQGEHDGRKIYRFTFKGEIHDSVYLEEIENAIRTGDFSYNEDLKTI